MEESARIIYKRPTDVMDLERFENIIKKFSGASYTWTTSGADYVTFYLNAQGGRDTEYSHGLSSGYLIKGLQLLESEVKKLCIKSISIDQDVYPNDNAFPMRGYMECKTEWECRQLQNKLFSLGYTWMTGKKEFIYSRYIYWEDMFITASEKYSCHCKEPNYTFENLFSNLFEYSGFPQVGQMYLNSEDDFFVIKNILAKKRYEGSYDMAKNYNPTCRWLAWGGDKKYFKTQVCLPNYPIYTLDTLYQKNLKIEKHELQTKTESNSGSKGCKPLKPYSGISKIASSKRLIGNTIPARRVESRIRETERKPRLLNSGYSEQTTRSGGSDYHTRDWEQTL